MRRSATRGLRRIRGQECELEGGAVVSLWRRSWMEEIPQTEAELPTLPEGSVEGVDCYERLESLLQGRQKDPCDEGAGCSCACA